MKNSVLIEKNEERWTNVTYKTSALNKAAIVAKRLVAAKDRYVAISNKTGVPWFIIAVIHEREASQRWDRSIAQGDPWNKVSVHVPRGRGPFNSFEDAAVDALVDCAPYAAKWTDWSAGGTLTLLELYNGLGYANRDLPSPYIWSGTNQYTSGKYVADGVFDPDAVDAQLGCAALIEAMHEIDPDVCLGTALPPDTVASTNEDVNTPKAGPVGDTTETKPAKDSREIVTSVIGILTALGTGAWTAFDKALTDWKVIAVLAIAGLFGYVIWARYNKDDIKGFW